MIPSLVRLPATVVDDLETHLVACVTTLGVDRTIVIGPHRTTEGHSLDEFVLASALAAEPGTGSIGVAALVGAGRTASVIAREATAAQLLGACDVLVLEGEPAACADAAAVITTLFTPGPHTLTAGAERIDEARNLPQPSVDGGPPVVWRDGDGLFSYENGTVTRSGDAMVVSSDEDLPVATPATLVELDFPVVPSSVLAATLSA